MIAGHEAHIHGVAHSAAHGMANAGTLLALPQLVACPQCGEMRVSHHVCPNCGTYRGHTVIVMKERPPRAEA